MISKAVSIALAIAIGLLGRPALAAEAKPAVLFAHGIHSSYAARPLHDMGVEVDTCRPQELAARLESGRYNVAVASSLGEAELKALGAFLAKGGGVLVCNPNCYSQETEFTATCGWLAGLGARPRWEMFQDDEKSNVARDVMGCSLSFSGDIAGPFNRDVVGVLTLLCNSTGGWEPPMSFDLDANWRIAVRGARSMKSVIDNRHDEVLQRWLPAAGIPSAPPLMAVRDVGKGRLAVLAIRYYWLFTPPYNCPTAEAMLTAGADGKKSQWLRLFANAFRWLAEPSMKAGQGGATTPESILSPPRQVWPPPAQFDWAGWSHGNVLEKARQLQTAGLVGARTALSSGKGAVADYVKEAKAAGLQFIVFMEDALAMDQAKWDRLIDECRAATDKDFAAIPGLTYEDAQGDHLYAFSDNVKYPKPGMLLAGKRLATTQQMRSRAYFDYDCEYLAQEAIRGYWNHKKNYLHFADYKLYNSFPAVSFEDGKPVDDALGEFLYLQGIGGCHAIVAFEFMTGPDQVARRATGGWRVVVHRPPAALREKWYEGAWSFSGSGSQYITNGPEILVWDSPNRLTDPHGQWWRPDLWEYRLRLRVAAAAGLKSVTIHDGDRGILRRWLPGGAKEFQQEMVFANCQQLGPTLVVEDAKGRRAVSMSFWNRNLVKEEFFCSDRCNFLGSSRLRARTGEQVWTPVGFQANMGITPSKGRLDMSVSPAVGLTVNSPTLPIDGAPAGFPTVSLGFNPQVPGEMKHIFAYPQTYLVGPEIGIGQADWKLAYDPAEEGARATPLGHPYRQPQDGWGNSWGSWHRLVPTRMAEGYQRTYAWNWVPGEFRIGWHETDLAMKEAVALDSKSPGLRIMEPSMNGWRFFRDGRPVDVPQGEADVPFVRGTFAALEQKGGSVVLAPMEGPVTVRLRKDGGFSMFYVPATGALAKGDRVRYRVAFAGASGAAEGMPNGTPLAKLAEFAEKFGVARPGRAGYEPKVARGTMLDNYLAWRADAQGKAVEAKIARTAMPGLLPVVVEGLVDNWSVQLLDKTRAWPNHRALPVRGGCAYAELDLNEGDLDLFIGHPVIADDRDLKLLVSWECPGLWYVEAHNAADKPLKAALAASPGWPLFAFDEKVSLAPGASRIWHVRQEALARKGQQ